VIIILGDYSLFLDQRRNVEPLNDECLNVERLNVKLFNVEQPNVKLFECQTKIELTTPNLT
jgi:hypothetical protein